MQQILHNLVSVISKQWLERYHRNYIQVGQYFYHHQQEGQFHLSFVCSKLTHRCLSQSCRGNPEIGATLGWMKALMSLYILCQAIWQGGVCPPQDIWCFSNPGTSQEESWGHPSLPWCPSADTIHMPSAPQQFLLLWAWCVGSGCQRGTALRKGDRWELVLCFPAKYPPKLIWLILFLGMSKTLTCESMENTKPNYHCITSLSAELQHFLVWMLSTHVNSW